MAFRREQASASVAATLAEEQRQIWAMTVRERMLASLRLSDDTLALAASLRKTNGQ